MLVIAIRCIAAAAGVALLASQAHAAPPSGTTPASSSPSATEPTTTHPAKTHASKTRASKTHAPKTHSSKTEPAKIEPAKTQRAKTHKDAGHKTQTHTDQARTDQAHTDQAHNDRGRKLHDHKAQDRRGESRKTATRKESATPVSLAPPAPVPTTASVPFTPAIGNTGVMLPPPPARRAHTTPPMALASTTSTSPVDLAAVKVAVELVHKSRQDEATSVEATIGDPLARKLVEWVILRSDDSNIAFSRYAEFIAANPSWPSIVTLRRRAEAALWQQQVDPHTVIGFFAHEAPLSAKGSFALARAFLAQGDTARAQTAVRAAWRHDGFSEDLESQVRAAFASLITPGDDKARMDARFYVEDDEGGMRAARRLGGAELAIARARAAVINKAGNAKALFEAVPAEAQRDPGYMFSRIHWLRHADKIKEAAQWMLAVPHDPALLVDLDQWWVERRLLARKLIDLGDVKTAYEVAAGASPPPNENYRAEQQFTAGWIALRFLHEPSVALGHFAHVADGTVNPITLARSFYWQGRAAAALRREPEARAAYEVAARYPTAYYGQLARAQLKLNEVTLRELPQAPPEARPLELARSFEILYAIDEHDLVASMAADIADKTSDVDALAALAGIAAHHGDARVALLIGKTALGRGFAFERYAFPDFGVPNFRPIGPPVERSVIFSIVRQESAFNARVVSSANALGLMQVTPAAGRATARKFRVAFDQRRLLTDPSYNVQLGAAELGDDMQEFRGSYILAFASYNAGRGRVKEWIETYGDPRDPRVDPIDWIERIPFSETRNYLERVMENTQIYRAILGGGSKLLIEADLRRGG